MKFPKCLFFSPFFLMATVSLASPPSHHNPIGDKNINISKENKSFRIPEHIFIYKMNESNSDTENLKDIVTRVNETGAFSESYLPKHSVFYERTFNVSEKRKVVLAECVSDDGKILLDKNVMEPEANKFLNEKVKRDRKCNSFTMLSKGVHHNNDYDIYDIVFVGKLFQYPNDNSNDPSFRNNISFMKSLSLTKFSLNTKSNFLHADFVTGYDTSYIVIRKFDIKDLNDLYHKK